jgi:outer membrane protein TolC
MKLLAFLLCFAAAVAVPAAEPVTLEDCLALALQQNPTIRNAQHEIQRRQGLVLQARAAALPQLTATGQYKRVDDNAIEIYPFQTSLPANEKQPWAATVEVSQLLYAGGRVRAAVRAAKLAEQIAVLDFQRTVADVLLAVRQTFYRVLLTRAQITVREQAVQLLQQQLHDVQLRFAAGTVPQFNVLRAEVELANARPALIRAQNDHRLAKEALARLLALDDPAARPAFTPLTVAGQLEFARRDDSLPAALTQALARRPELQQAAKRVQQKKEAVTVATAGAHPQFSLFADYGIRNTTYGSDLDDTVHGWAVGVKATWNLFDGLETRGKVVQAKAELQQADCDAADTRRRIEFEVRQAYSDYLQACELIAAQKKVVAQAEESLRLATARFNAGSGTQLDVLSAQTALTEARSNEIQALYDYNVALAALDRATGATVQPAP